MRAWRKFYRKSHRKHTSVGIERPRHSWLGIACQYKARNVNRIRGGINDIECGILFLVRVEVIERNWASNQGIAIQRVMRYFILNRVWLRSAFVMQNKAYILSSSIGRI